MSLHRRIRTIADTSGENTMLGRCPRLLELVILVIDELLEEELILEIPRSIFISGIVIYERRCLNQAPPVL